MKTTRIMVLGIRAEPWSVSAGANGMMYKSEKLKKFQKDLRLIIGAKMRALKLPNEAIRMDLIVIRKRSMTAAKKAKSDFEWHIMKPDRDNFLKATQDALKDYWPDDCIVCSGTTDKMFGPDDALCIVLSEPEPVAEVLAFYGITKDMF